MIALVRGNILLGRSNTRVGGAAAIHRYLLSLYLASGAAKPRKEEGGLSSGLVWLGLQCGNREGCFNGAASPH